MTRRPDMHQIDEQGRDADRVGADVDAAMWLWKAAAWVLFAGFTIWLVVQFVQAFAAQ